VKLARLRKPKAARFISYVEYRSNTSGSNIMKNRKSHKREGGREGKRRNLRR
jgi:hypothetical protein